MKRITIRIPLDIWKKLKMLQIDGEIESIQAAVIEGLKLIIKKKERKS